MKEKAVKLLVVGDVMLDEAVVCDAPRDSSGLKVFRIESHESAPGGAGNAAVSAAMLGAEVSLVGAVGSDPDSMLLDTILCSAGVMTHLQGCSERPTTKKATYWSEGRRRFRLDRESTCPVSGYDEKVLCGAVGNFSSRADAVLLSDYAKGTCTPAVLDAVFGCGKPVYVNCRPTEIDKHRRAACVIMTEAEWGTLPIEAYPFCDRVATYPTGATWYPAKSDDVPYDSPGFRTPCVDSTGAGDTFCAAYALSRAVGDYRQEESLRYANAAAASTVGRRGTVPPEMSLMEELLTSA